MNKKHQMEIDFIIVVNHLFFTNTYKEKLKVFVRMSDNTQPIDNLHIRGKRAWSVLFLPRETCSVYHTVKCTLLHKFFQTI